MAKGGKGKKGKIDLCASGDKECSRPEGTVVWVFCEACDGWFHCPCANVDGKKATDEDFIFVCKGCKPRKEKEFISMKPELKRQIGLIMDRHPVFSTALIARRCFASKSASNEYHFGRPGIPVTLRELEEKMMRDVSSVDHFKHMAKVMVERMVASVKGEFNSEAKIVKTEIEKMLKAVTAPPASTSVNNTVGTKNQETPQPANQRNKRGSNKENNAVADKTEESTEKPVNAKKSEPQKQTRGKRGNAKKTSGQAKPEVKPEIKPEVKPEPKPEVKPAAVKAAPPARKRAKKVAEKVEEKTVAPVAATPAPSVKVKTETPKKTEVKTETPETEVKPNKKRTSRRGGAGAKKSEKSEDLPEKPVKQKGRPKVESSTLKKVESNLKVEEKLGSQKLLPQETDTKPIQLPTTPLPKLAKVLQKTVVKKPKEEPETEIKPAEIIEKAVTSPPIAPAPAVVKPEVVKGGRKRKNASALAPVTSNAKAAKVQKTAAAAAVATAAAKASVVTSASIASIATSGSGPPLAAKIITGSPGSPAKIAITGNNLVNISSLTQPLPPQVVLPTTPVAATQVQSVKSSAPCPPQVIQLRPAGTSLSASTGSATSGGMQIRPLMKAAGMVGGGVGPRPQFFKIVGGKPVQISNLQRLPAGSAVSALQQAPAGSRVVYMRAPAPAGGTGTSGGAQAASVVVTSSGSATTTSSATAPAGTVSLPAGSSGGATTGNKIILLSNKGQAIPVSGKGTMGGPGGPSIVRIVSPNSLTTTSGGKLTLAPNSPTKVMRPATGATGPILLRTVAPRPTSTAAPPIQLPMAPLPKSALTNNPTTTVTVTGSVSGDKAKIVSCQNSDTTAKAIQVLLPKSPLPPTNSNIISAVSASGSISAGSTGAAPPTSPQKSPTSGSGMTTTTTTTTASGAFVWTNSTRANFKLSSRINFASLDKFKNVVNKDVHFILASIVTEDKSNEFSFRLHLKREASKGKKATEIVPQQSYLELEGKAKVPTAQEWSLKVKTEPPVFLVSKGNFLSDFPAVRIPKEIAEKPFVDYELHIDKCSPMQVATTAATAVAMATSGGAAKKSGTGNTGGGVLPAKRARKPKVQS